MSATGSQSSPTDDANFFSKWSRKFSVVTGLGITEGERLRELETHQNNACNRWKKELMNYSGFALPPSSSPFGRDPLNTHNSRPSRSVHAETA
jgi:hypothetical protein